MNTMSSKEFNWNLNTKDISDSDQVMDLDHRKEHETLSLCGDIQFRVSLVPRGVTEEKLQRILDSRLPQALVELWKSKKRNVQGRISVPSFLATFRPFFGAKEFLELSDICSSNVVFHFLSRF